MKTIRLRILGNKKDAEEYGIALQNESYPRRFLEMESAHPLSQKLSSMLPVIRSEAKHTLWFDITALPTAGLKSLLAGQVPENLLPHLDSTPATREIHYRGNTLTFNGNPRWMGIVNITPDSFSDGGKYFQAEAAVRRIEQLITEGADIIDLGAESTRPGSERISADEEWRRLEPVLELLSQKQLFRSAWFSLDTYKGSIARKALAYGISIINDISAGRMDPSILEVVAEYGCPYIIMHMQGTPENMQKNPTYTHLMDEILDFFEERITAAQQAGIRQIILDPGIGFGKRIEDNYEMIRRLGELGQFGYPVLLAASRKSFLWRKLEIAPSDADFVSVIAHMEGIRNGAHIIRVHDLKIHRQGWKVFQWLQELKATI